MSNYNQLTANLERLNLKHMLLHLDESIDFATRNSLSFVDALLKLSNHEIEYKAGIDNTRMMMVFLTFPFFGFSKEALKQ